MKIGLWTGKKWLTIPESDITPENINHLKELGDNYLSRQLVINHLVGVMDINVAMDKLFKEEVN